MKVRFIALTLVFIAVNISAAADWPQWRGPNRDARSAETGLITKFPASGPKLLWTNDSVGAGYSGPAIVGDTLYTLGAEEEEKGQVVIALDVATGKERWRKPVPTLQIDEAFKSGRWGSGPRSTPTVDGDRLYIIGANGDIACLDRATGNIKWQKSMVRDMHGKVMMMWGYSESPLIDGDLVICSPGYEKDKGEGGVQALHKMTGEVKWVCKELLDMASYSSLVISNGAGIKQYVGLTAAGAFGVAAADGKLLWHTKLGASSIAVIPTPVISGDLVYITNDYGAGCGTLELSKTASGVAAKELFKNKAIDNHHGGVVLHQNAIFGFNGNANAKKPLPLVCQDIKTGDVLWQKKDSLEASSVIFADGHLWCYGQKTGTLVTVKADTKEYVEVGKFTIPKTSSLTKPQGGIWTHPVIANGRLYLRDQELLYCFDVAGGPKAE